MSNFLHWLAHKWDRSAAPCVCRVAAFQAGIQARRDAERAEATLPKSPDELDAAFRRLIAESEA